MPISECPSARCRTNNAKGQLCLQVRGSKFTKFQEVKSSPLDPMTCAISVHYSFSFTVKTLAIDIYLGLVTHH
jgi:hypothetical protein